MEHPVHECHVTFIIVVNIFQSSVVLDSQNIVQVTQALVDGVSMSDLVDQTPHNLAVVGDVLNRTAALLQNTSDIAFLATAQQVCAQLAPPYQSHVTI